MTKDNFFYLGKIIRTKGYKGELKVYFDVDDPSYYQELDAVFIEQKRNLIPYSISSIHIEDNKANLKLKDINREEDATQLVNCNMYLPLELLPKLEGNRFYYHEIEGFRVTDTNLGELGIIKEVLDYPANPLFYVIKEDKEVLIPINDEIIRKVDRENKNIEVETPEGLVDVYI